MQAPNIDISNSSMQKGLVREGKSLIAWDCIQECHTEDCPIRNACLFKPLPTDEVKKCNVQIQYLNALTDMVFTTYRYLNDDVLYKIGMHIIPLYSMLCRQKIVEKSLINITFLDNKGNIKMHPIYKEIRETMRIISDMWKSVGVLSMPDPEAGTGRVGFGDNGHYAKISENSDNKKGIIR